MAWEASLAFLILRLLGVLCQKEAVEGEPAFSLQPSPFPFLPLCLPSCLVHSVDSPAPMSKTHPPLPNSCTLTTHRPCNVHSGTAVQPRPSSRGPTQGRGPRRSWNGVCRGLSWEFGSPGYSGSCSMRGACLLSLWKGLHRDTF